MHTAPYGARAGRRGKRPRLPIVTAEQFRELREFTGKTREDVAELVGVSLRTVGHWETGAARPSYAAFRLLRVMLRGDTLHPGWEGYRFVRGKLVAPEGWSFGPGDMAWISLLVQRANFTSLRAIAAKQHEAMRSGGRLLPVDAQAGVVAASEAHIAPAKVSGRRPPSSNREVSETERTGSGVSRAKRRAVFTQSRLAGRAPGNGAQATVPGGRTARASRAKQPHSPASRPRARGAA
ncbi:VC1465 family Xer recombination activation factor [Thermomonas brevis]